MGEIEQFEKWAREFTGEHQLRYDSGQKWGEYSDRVRELSEAWNARADLAAERIAELEARERGLLEALRRLRRAITPEGLEDGLAAMNHTDKLLAKIDAQEISDE